MKTSDAIKSFDGVASLARSLGISTAAVYQWGDEVPPLRAYQIKELLDRKGNECSPSEQKQAA